MQTLGNCPLCDGSIVEKENSFGCSNSKWLFDDTFDEWQNHGCLYSIAKKALQRYGKRTISKSDVRTLFREGTFIAELKARGSKGKVKYLKYVYVNEEYGISVDFDTEVEETL